MGDAGHDRVYKPGIDRLALRKRLEKASLEIRKAAKEHHLKQRRRFNNCLDAEMKEKIYGDTDILMIGQDMDVARELIRLAAKLHSRHRKDHFDAVVKLRCFLSSESSPPIQKVIDLGLIPLLVNCLEQHDLPPLQFQAAWALTNIATEKSNYTEVVMRAGAVPILCGLILSRSDEVCEQAIWALANISGDSPAFRDFVIQSGAMVSLLVALRCNKDNPRIMRNAVWLISNLCRGKPKPDFDDVSPALEFLGDFVCSTNQEIVVDACWSLSYLSKDSSECIQMILDMGICSRLIMLIESHFLPAQLPAIRTLGNIAGGLTHQTQALIDLGILPRLASLLQKNDMSPTLILEKEACWIISNITGGTKGQIQSVIDANVIPSLVRELTGGEFAVKKKAAWAIANAADGGSIYQVKYLVDQGCIPPLLDLLRCTDLVVASLCLDTIYRILHAGKNEKNSIGSNEIADYIHRIDGMDTIQALQFHPNKEIRLKAIHIYELYFSGEDDTKV